MSGSKDDPKAGVPPASRPAATPTGEELPDRPSSDPLQPMPVARTRPPGWTGPRDERVERVSSAPRASDPPAGLIRGGAAANSELDALVAASVVDFEARIGALVAHRYRLERWLGQGGVGAVYLAEVIPSGERVAVKLLHREFASLPEVAARFEREATAASSFEHPNVAGALDFGRLPDGTFFLVLEYVAGVSLAAVLDLEGPLPAPRSLRIARSIAAALGAAHRAGIVHRDLKPKNVMLTEHPGADTVKVVDFGVAQLPADVSARLTPAVRATIAGTPEYMAPEQAAGTIVDQRADLYTLGVVLYEMLVGDPPFRDESMEAVLRLQMTALPPSLPHSVDFGTSALVGQLLAKDPDQRPSTADEVVRRIDQLLDPTSAPTSSPGGRGTATGRQLSSRPGERRDSSRPALPPEDSSARADFMRDAVSSRSPVSRRLVPAPPRRARGALAWTLAGVALVVAVALAAWLALPSRRTAVGLARTVENWTQAEPSALARVRAGEPTAVAELERRDSLGAEEWMALGRGRSAQGRLGDSVDAYARGVAAAPRHAKDPNLARDLRRALDDREAESAALELALGKLRATGVDLVYDVWSEARRDPGSAARATRYKQRLDDPQVAARASPALAVALALWAGTTCESYRALLPSAEAVADERSLPVMQSLGRTQGCGPDQREDCFACLRKNGTLVRASAAAAARPAPRF